jgi:hypothetical protein
MARVMGNIRRVILLGSITVRKAIGALADAEVKLDRRGNGGQ